MRLQNEIIFYHSKRYRCPCNENVLVSSMLGIDVPCCHRVKLGALFPPCPIVRLTLSNQWINLNIEYCVVADDIDISDADEDYYDKLYIKEQIRRYSHFKDNEQISNFVEAKYSYDGNAFLGKQPISTVELITEGIAYFTALRHAQLLEEYS